MTEEATPFEHLFDLRDLGQAGASVKIVLNGTDLERLAHWAGVEKVEKFAAKIDLEKFSSTRFRLEANLEADIVQECVVTLEPVRSHIARDFSRELHLIGPAKREPEAPAPLTLTAGDDDAPDEIESTTIDLAASLLEELSLGIDPYPRAPGVAFEAPNDEASGPHSPFAVLKTLKKR